MRVSRSFVPEGFHRVSDTDSLEHVSAFQALADELQAETESAGDDLLVVEDEPARRTLRDRWKAWRATRVNFWKSKPYRGIECFWGLPGSGKSYELARWALMMQKRGYHVFTTSGFAIPGSYIIYSIEDFMAVPNGSIICVDEADQWFDARAWQSQPAELRQRLTHVRKYDIHMRYTAIDPHMVDVNLRRITFHFKEFRRLIGPWNMWRRSKSPEGAPRTCPENRPWSFRRMRSHVALAYDTLDQANTTEWYSKQGEKK